MGNRGLVRLSVISAIAVFGSWTVPPQAAWPQATTAPVYNDDDHLVLPEGFETWVFVGADLGLVYKPEAFAMTSLEAARSTPHEVFHNIYINPEAYEYFRANKEFPDPTILVMEEFEANDKDPDGVLARGVFEDTRVGLEVAVKNSARPDDSPTPWAYYVFMSSFDPTHQLAQAAEARPDGSCFNCHDLHASKDNVWVQFYPTLRKLLD